MTAKRQCRFSLVHVHPVHEGILHPRSPDCKTIAQDRFFKKPLKSHFRIEPVLISSGTVSLDEAETME